MKYEQVYEYIGQIGRYQWFIFSLVFYCSMYCVDSIHIIFIGGNMDHWCLVDELDGLPYDIQKNVAIPTETSADGLSTVYSSCKMFALNYSVYNQSEFETWNRTKVMSENTPIVRCEQWTYDQSTFQSTIVKKFGLVCGQEYLIQLASTLLMAGILFGALASGVVSDRFGRKTSMLSFCCVKLCGNLMSIFGPNYAVFGVGRFLIGFGQYGYFVPGFALVMELVGPRYRCGLGCSLQIAFSVGFMLQPAIAYALRDEFTYQLAAVGPIFALPFLIWFFIPESTRWLIVQRKYDRALKQLQLVCRVNGTKLPPNFDPQNLQEETGVVRKNCLALLSSPELRRRTVLIDFSWFTCGLIYYALSLNTGTLYGNIYLNTFFSGLVEVPAYIVSIFLMDMGLFGRRGTGGLSLIAAGIISFMCIPLTLFNFNFEASMLSLVGKAFISISYSVVYVFATEIFPTEVRMIGMGTGNMFSRIASMAAPFVGGPLAGVWKPLPSLLFGTCATVSGLSYALMPETLGRPLADTIAEAEHLCTSNGNEHQRRLGLRCKSQKDSNSSQVDYDTSQETVAGTTADDVTFSHVSIASEMSKDAPKMLSNEKNEVISRL